jgi:hypothetical protein
MAKPDTGALGDSVEASASTSVSRADRRRLRGPRRLLRDAVFGFVRRILEADEGRSLLASVIPGVDSAQVLPEVEDLLDQGPVYSDLGRPESAASGFHDRDPVIITARFRSGSTLLWNIFRNVDSCTAYYEPFNERRWFDAASRGAHTDATHLGVSDYWREYDGLEALATYYSESWINRRLHMDSRCWNPEMKTYVALLIAAAPRRPVLQFNRIDFRLPWFRHNFPRAQVIHLYRHPRDQWVSTLVDPSAFPKDANPSQFAAHDHYYLLAWAQDLKYQFPFLDPRTVEHPYQLFYLIWKLSYLYGRTYADRSVSFEDLVRHPDLVLPPLLHAVGIRQYDHRRVMACVVEQRSRGWQDYAEDDWFKGHEIKCETLLCEFFRARAASASRNTLVGAGC